MSSITITGIISKTLYLKNKVNKFSSISLCNFLGKESIGIIEICCYNYSGGGKMDFTPLELEQGAERWNYYLAVDLIKECEKLALTNDLLRIPNTFTRIVSESYSKAIITTKEILMALSRILYESMVIMRFLYVHRDNEQLLERYIDDYYVKVSRDRIKYCNYILEYSHSEDEKNEAQRLKIDARKKYNALKEKYSEYLSYNKQGNYLHDYWWIGDVMRSRNFGAIQNEITLENLKILYVLSCYRAHSGIVGNSVRFGTILDVTTLSTKGSLDGFQIPLFFSLVCFGILTETMFNTVSIDCKKIIDGIEKIIEPYENCLYR